MDLPNKKTEWQRGYRATVDALQAVEDEDLATMSDEEALRRIGRLTVVGIPWRERTEWSGLVEQQALFHKHRKPS